MIEGETFEVGPGSAVYIPLRKLHQVFNDSPRRMKFVSDSALARCIHEARRAPDADAHGLKVIRTPRHHPPDPRQGRPPTLVRRPR